MRILIVRNDKIGDFMLAWPAFRAIKESLPQADVVALVPPYTRPLAELCPWIDETLTDPGADAGLAALVTQLRHGRFDAVITLYSTPRIGAATWLACIPYRLAPATKWAQVFYNRRLTQRRSRSEKPEWAYNLELAAHFLSARGVTQLPSMNQPYLTVPASESAARRVAFCEKNHIPLESRLVFVHVGSGGSAVNLDINQYATLLQSLRSKSPLFLVLTAGPNEEAYTRELSEKIQLPHALLVSTDGLGAFARQLAIADLWISGSTGPLHISGALDVPTAAFYPRRRSATPLRWQTLNSPERRIAFTPPETAGETDMSAIDLQAAAAAISARFLS